MHNFYIVIKYKTLKLSKIFIKLVYFLNKINLFKSVSYFKFMSIFKKKKKLFSVLKSPHVFKTSQEQFEIKKNSFIIKIKTFNYIKFLNILKIIDKNFFSDLKIKILFSSKSNITFKSTSILKEKKKFLFFDLPSEKLMLFYEKLGEYFFINKGLDSSVGRAKD